MSARGVVDAAAGTQNLRRRDRDPCQRLRAAAVQYRVGSVDSWAAFVSRVAGMVNQGKAQGADLVVFPEYLCVDLLPVVAGRAHVTRDRLRGLFERLDDLFAAFREAMREIAAREKIWLIAGTFAHRSGTGFVNAAQIFGPHGEHMEQPKLHIAYELIENRDLIRPGDSLVVFDTLGARTAVLVCYDAQFPETARAIVDAGDIDILVIPGCTLEEWGIWRLRTAAAARAMESFAFAINAQLSGEVKLAADFPYRFLARSSIVSPISRPFGATGLLADSQENVEAVLVADLDIAALREARSTGYPSLHDRHARVQVKWQA